MDGAFDVYFTLCLMKKSSLILLLTLMFAGLEGAHYLYVEHQVVKGVRDGARYAARLPFDSVVDSTSVKNVTRTGNIAGGMER